MTPFVAKLVSNKPCFYHDTFFATGTRVSRKNLKSVTLCTLCPNLLVSASLLSNKWRQYDLISWLNSQQQSVCEPNRQLAPARAETDQFTSNEKFYSFY